MQNFFADLWDEITCCELLGVLLIKNALSALSLQLGGKVIAEFLQLSPELTALSLHLCFMQLLKPGDFGSQRSRAFVARLLEFLRESCFKAER